VLLLGACLTCAVRWHTVVIDLFLTWSFFWGNEIRTRFWQYVPHSATTSSLCSTINRTQRFIVVDMYAIVMIDFKFFQAGSSAVAYFYSDALSLHSKSIVLWSWLAIGMACLMVLDMFVPGARYASLHMIQFLTA